MAIVGVSAGASIDMDVLRTIGEQPAAVVLGVFATLAVTMAVGQILLLSGDVTRSTAAFASIAGGASGVSMIAEEFGADAPIVMSVQYLRVVVVLASVPLLSALLGGSRADGSAAAAGSDLSQFAFTATAMLSGLLLARLLKFSASEVVLPLLAASGLALWGPFPAASIPISVAAIGYTIIGLNVGLGFTRHLLRRLIRLLPFALLQTFLSVATCAGVGIVFASFVGVSPLVGYLATSPGGLPAVIAIAVESGEEVGLVLTMQVLRVFMALLCAPLLGKLVRRHD